MNLRAIDQRIRTSMPDGPERRLLLTDVADLSEGINQLLGWLLAVQGYSYDVMVYGGAVLDELAARGLKYNELQAAGMMAWSLCAAAILTESEVSDTEDFTGGAAASTG